MPAWSWWPSLAPSQTGGAAASAACDASSGMTALQTVSFFYQNASVQVSIMQLHPNLDDPYLGPWPLDAGDGSGAAGGGSPVRLCGGGWSEGGGGGVISWRRCVDIQTGYRGRPHVLQQKPQEPCSCSRAKQSQPGFSELPLWVWRGGYWPGSESQRNPRHRQTGCPGTCSNWKHTNTH